jgi:polyhydroxyalkanoate synthase
MNHQNQDAESASVQAAEALGPEAGLVASLDPLSLGRALGRTAMGAAQHPLPTALASLRLSAGLGTIGAMAALRAFGVRTAAPLPPPSGDRRFADPAWQHNALFFALQQSYLLSQRYAHDLVEAARLEPLEAQKAAFTVQLLTDALAPTNFLMGNPVALKKALDTGGLSVLRGVRNFLNDLIANNGKPRKVDSTPFELGENLAATPGKVVFRNRLIELLQYTPQTETVFEIPLLASPPWINKYYVMDLAPGRSFIEWAVKHGHTVFAISYRNPDSSMRDVSLDDYLLQGPLTALDVIHAITGAPQVNIVGLCLGGTLTMMLLAYLDAVGSQRIRSVTLLNTLVDFSDPGVLGCFTDPKSVQALQRKMARKGYLEGREMALTFDLLRANDLIWNYVANNWLMGEEPPPFDVLAWNEDSTRMPAAMHSFYLRTCYLENQLARGVMELAGAALHLDAVAHDLYLVGARNDHITPWKSSYKTAQLVKGEVRFVLSSSGHIAGIVNPPSTKARYWTGERLPADPELWLAETREHRGSWWEDWAAWIELHADQRRKPPPMGSERFPPLTDAPGSYVREK